MCQHFLNPFSCYTQPKIKTSFPEQVNAKSVLNFINIVYHPAVRKDKIIKIVFFIKDYWKIFNFIFSLTMI